MWFGKMLARLGEVYTRLSPFSKLQDWIHASTYIDIAAQEALPEIYCGNYRIDCVPRPLCALRLCPGACGCKKKSVVSGDVITSLPELRFWTCKHHLSLLVYYISTSWLLGLLRLLMVIIFCLFQMWKSGVQMYISSTFFLAAYRGTPTLTPRVQANAPLVSTGLCSQCSQLSVDAVDFKNSQIERTQSYAAIWREWMEQEWTICWAAKLPTFVPGN